MEGWIYCYLSWAMNQSLSLFLHIETKTDTSLKSMSHCFIRVDLKLSLIRLSFIYLVDLVINQIEPKNKICNLDDDHDDDYNCRPKLELMSNMIMIIIRIPTLFLFFFLINTKKLIWMIKKWWCFTFQRKEWNEFEFGWRNKYKRPLLQMENFFHSMEDLA